MRALERVAGHETAPVAGLARGGRRAYRCAAMALPPLKSVLPRSLLGRALLILLVPIVLLQLVVGLVFFQRHYQRVTEQMTRGVALEINYAIGVIEAATEVEDAARRLDAIAAPLRLALRLSPGAPLEPGLEIAPNDLTGRTLVATLQQEIKRPLMIDLATDDRLARIAVQTGMGLLSADVPRTRLSVSNPHQLLVLMILAAVVLTAIAILFLRNQVRPIRQLAEAAEAFGKGRSLPFRPAGAEEVRRAAAAFLNMRARLERQIEQRTQMLSGVSHDLRTPITRMKLSLELMEPSEDLDGLRQDIDQMERMLGEFLTFARGDSLEDSAPTDPVALAARIVEDAGRSGAEVRLLEPVGNGTGTAAVQMRAGAVQRAIENLVGNARRFGSEVTLQVRLLPKTVEFVVEDNGPGIPEADRARALAPFSRLESARPLDEGGSVGLGLAIALDIARSHGGALELGESTALGGSARGVAAAPLIRLPWPGVVLAAAM
jgi:two-component system, OmpR family, osmolarity sensor histidine kinase EnvZ